MKCEFGLCLVCEKKIMNACSTCNHKTKNGEYTEVLLNLSDGSKMPVAVCIACSQGPVWEADKDQVMDEVRKGWEKEQISHGWKKEKREEYKKKMGHLRVV